MSKFHADTNIDEQYLFKIAKDMIATCSDKGLNYISIHNQLDNSLNKSVDALTSILHDELDESSYNNLLKSIKIQPFRRLAEEIKKYKARKASEIKKLSEENKKIKLNILQEQDSKLHHIQESILTTAKQSKSQKIKLILSSIDLSSADIPVEKLKAILSLLIQEGENLAQVRMAKIYYSIIKMFNKTEKAEMLIPLEKSERLILQTVQTVKDKINKYTEESIKTNSVQTQLISILQSQIDDLSNEINFKNETQLFEKEIKKNFENDYKYDELLENYKKAFRKIEEVTNSKKELLLRNGNLETQNLLLQQKFNDSIDENKQLKRKIQDYQLKNKRTQ